MSYITDHGATICRGDVPASVHTYLCSRRVQS